MEIKSTFVDKLGRTLNIIYNENSPTIGLDGKILQSVCAFCFYKEKMIVAYAENKGYWTPPGGGIEQGESIEEAVIREVREETNMKVIYQKLIGYQDVYEPDHTVRQTRSFCVVEPIGDFVIDPDGDITEIKLIDPKDYKKYFDWGIIGERILKVALKLKNEL